MSGLPLLGLIILAILWIIFSSSLLKMHPVWGLLGACLLVGLGSGQAMFEVLTTITAGFGRLMGSIGLIIVFGALLGVILERTGGTIALADGILALFGKRFPGLAMGVIGAIVSIPVFCDSAFIVLSRINRALGQRTSIAPATLYLSLAGGLYLTHNLVPPTPGPVAAAGNLGLDQHLGTIILVGLIISVPVLVVAWWWSRRSGTGITLVEDEAGEAPVKQVVTPPLLRVAPALLAPILLLALGTLFPLPAAWRWVSVPEVALVTGVFLAFLLLGLPYRSEWRSWTEQGIHLAGPILIITGVGGSFGAVLANTAIVETAGNWLGGSPDQAWVLLLAAFALAALLKTAQGSSTSALVVGSSIFAPLLVGLEDLSVWQQALLVSALGAGAMVVSHANDSFFWVVSQFSGLRVADAYRSYTLLTLWMGLAALAMVLVLFMI